MAENRFALPDAERDRVSDRRALEAELRTLRDRVAQRDVALAQLNRRLLQFERGELPDGSPSYERVQTLRSELQVMTERLREVESALEVAQARAASAERELIAMRDTKLFRWSGPLRSLYRTVGLHR